MKLPIAADRWLFGHGSPLCLGVLRILLIGYLTTCIPQLVADVEAAGELPAEFMAPGIVLRLHPLPFPLPVHWIGGFQTILMQLGLLAALGLFTRFTTFCFAFGYVYLEAVQSAWGWHDHGPSLVIQVLGVMPFLPGIDSLSLDRLWRRVFRGGSGEGLATALAGPPAPQWGVHLVLILVAMFYFASGFAKLRISGLDWLDGHTLSFYMSGNSLSSHVQQLGTMPSVGAEDRWRDGIGLTHYLYGARPSALARRMAEVPTLMASLSVATIALEVGFLLVLAGGVLRTGLLLAGAAFHVAIYFLMGISFIPWAILDFAMIDWSTVAPRRGGGRD